MIHAGGPDRAIATRVLVKLIRVLTLFFHGGLVIRVVKLPSHHKKGSRLKIGIDKSPVILNNLLGL
jgi:hypothetical protein